MTLEEVQGEVSEHIDTIKTYFKPGAKVMVMVGFDGDPHGGKDFVMGDMDPQEAMNMGARALARGRA